MGVHGGRGRMRAIRDAMGGDGRSGKAERAWPFFLGGGGNLAGSEDWESILYTRPR